MNESSYEAIVVGGGVMGLCALRHLQRRGLRRVLLLERDVIGSLYGSSHGKSRITRAAYEDPMWVRMVLEALRADWPLLEKEAGEQLIFPCDGLFFGPEDGLLPVYAAAVQAAGARVEGIGRAQAAARFPQFRLLPGEGALWDRTAGVVAADRVLAGLRAVCLASGATIREGVRVEEIDAARTAVRTADGELRAERIIVCAGPWAGGLVPHLAPGLRPTRQSVGYFDVGADPVSFPVWVWLGRALHEHVYGLPAFGHAGIKAALFDVDTDIHDLDAVTGAVDVSGVRRFLEQHLAVSLGATLHAEACRFTNTPQADFVLAPWPGHPSVVIGAGFSGHGFKLAPLVGRVLAELALDGRTSVEEVEADRGRFAGDGPGTPPAG
jgi:sarcosine oxidase